MDTNMINIEPKSHFVILSESNPNFGFENRIKNIYRAKLSAFTFQNVGRDPETSSNIYLVVCNYPPNRTLGKISISDEEMVYGLSFFEGNPTEQAFYSNLMKLCNMSDGINELPEAKELYEEHNANFK
jgi:hypothetical protein